MLITNGLKLPKYKFFIYAEMPPKANDRFEVLMAAMTRQQDCFNNVMRRHDDLMAKLVVVMDEF